MKKYRPWLGGVQSNLIGPEYGFGFGLNSRGPSSH
jgi:hypothetical protein